jgi:tetratricopeptide (TPR) repeat protein
MISQLKTICVCTLLLLAHSVFAQDPQQQAADKGREAIKLMDNGKIEESLALLEEAQKLDPDKFIYPYEIAYAYYLREDYKTAIKQLNKIKKHKDVQPQLYQLLGNAYDLTGDPKKALSTYDDGLKIFPASGMLYLEKGNVYWLQKEYNKALPFYEKGIEADPTFPSNYYRAAILYCNSDAKIWGVIYGEIFMNLEPGSKRTAEVSKMLFDNYKSQIKFTSDTSVDVNLCSKNITISLDALKDATKFKLPFCLVYTPLMTIAAIPEKNITLASLDRIRSSFIDFYFQKEHEKTYPNVLFSFQKKIKDAGHFEAYNHWLFSRGDADGFEKWMTANTSKWKDFTTWFNDNDLELDKDNRFHSTQYN